MAHLHFRHVVGTVCLCCNMRDTDLPDIKNMQWTENAHGVGTIPGHMSIRAPPTSIGIGGRKEKLIGITNHEVSERYILKLQKDRERNNQAVFRSLENLPITIRHVPKYRIQSEPTVYTSRAAIGTEARPSSMKSISSEDITYQRPLNTTDVNLDANSSDKKQADKSAKEFLRSEFKKSKVAGPMCPHLMSLSACRKCVRLKKRRRRPDVKKETVSTVTTGILGNDLNIQAEGNSNQGHDISYNPTHSEPKKVVHTSGFHGHQLRSSKSVKVPKKNSSAFGLPASGNSTFQKKYARVFDSNQQIHFVNTSLMTGQRAGKLGKTFKTLPGIRASGESQRLRESTEVFAIKSVQRSNNPFAQTSIQSVPSMDDDISPAPMPIQPMHSFASDISDMPHVNLDGREHAEPSDGYKVKGPFVNTHDFSVSISEIELQKDDETKNDMHISLSRSDPEVLSCRARHMTPGKTESKPNLHKSRPGYYEDGHKKGRYQINKATSRQSQEPHNRKIGPEMQFSVRIEYKKTEDEPTPRDGTYSEILNMPRWVEKEKSNVESFARENIKESAVEEMLLDQGRYIRDAGNVGGINNYPLSNDKSYPNKNYTQNPQSNDFNGKSKNGFEVGDTPFPPQEMIDYSENKHDSSQKMASEKNVDSSDFSGESIKVPSDETRNTVVQSKELRQKSSPESGFVSIPCGSDKTNVETDDVTVDPDESTFESAKTVADSEGKRVKTTESDLDSGDGQIVVNADENISVETETSDNSVINRCGVINKSTEISGQKYDDFSDQPTGDESPDSMGEVEGGFFVTTLDPSEPEETENKGVPSSNDSGIAQEDLNLLQEYTNDDLQETTSSRNVMRPSRIGIGLSHDIQA